ncbi:MAG: hypothetical protein RBS19_07450 [Bacteroidales bacterium]|nr:hypothetical protein [Bacteroidales bacterium]
MKPILLLILTISCGMCFGQTDTNSAANPAYSEILVVNEYLFAINNKGQITIWDLKTLDKKFEMQDTIPKFSTV